MVCGTAALTGIRLLWEYDLKVQVHILPKVCSKSAHVEYGLTGLSGWVALLRKNQTVPPFIFVGGTPKNKLILLVL